MLLSASSSLLMGMPLSRTSAARIIAISQLSTFLFRLKRVW
ncbi:hypothetical protein C4K23_2569 [Pseudomonas chlororaphis]|nr:hypothetical protein C4K23_2569 [Pseudomonas chlororaphis]